MSTQAFARLLYTDCRPGEGRGGGGGYQIQAQSADCSPAQARIAVRWLLYSAQARWVADGRPAEAFPLGMAHTAAAGFGTAQSRYLGKEVNGSRQGNYLSDCVLTEHAASYGVIRPAQLWRAPFWRDEAWPTTTCPEFNGNVDLGPLDHDAIADWLRASQRRSEGLAQLLSVLEDGDGIRVVIRADDPEAALYWIAASTILLPISRAVEITFRVFTNSIDDAPHRIVAVPSDLHPNLVPGSRSRTFIIDATSDQTDIFEPSARAAFWVRQLMRAGEPYDVVEAVEMAAVLGGSTDQERSDARIAAVALCVRDLPIEDVVGLGRWVRGALASDHADAAQSVITRLVQAEGVRVDDLRLLDLLGAERRLGIDAAELRMRLLAAEIAEATTGAGTSAAVLSPVALTAADRAEGERALFSAIIHGSDAAVDRLLQVAWRHNLGLESCSPAIIERLVSFVSGLLSTPGCIVPLDRWALGDLIADEFHGQLRGMFLAGQLASVRTALPQVASVLILRGIDVTDPFTWEIVGSHMASLPAVNRIGRSREIIRDLERVGSESQFVAYQQGLVDWRAVDPPTALDIVRTIPACFSLHPEILRIATKELLVRAERPDVETLGVIEALSDRKALPAHPRLNRIASSGKVMTTLLEKLERIRPSDDLRDLQHDLRALRQADPGVVELSIARMTQAAMVSYVPELGQSILRFLSSSNGVSFARRWGHYLPEFARGPLAAARASIWIMDSHIPSEVRDELQSQVLQHLATLREIDVAYWKSMAGQYLRSDAERAFWVQMANSDPPARRRGLRLRGRT